MTAGATAMLTKIKKILGLARVDKFWDFIRTGPINTVSFIPLLLAIALVLIWIGLKNALLIIPQIYNYFILCTASMLLGSTGLIYIYRREMPGPVSSVTIKGSCAVIIGLIFLIFFWFLGLAGFVLAIFE
jgi:hypothetical protein